MPLDVRGRTRATLKWPSCFNNPAPKGVGNPFNPFRDLGLGIVIIAHERGIPSKRES